MKYLYILLVLLINANSYAQDTVTDNSVKGSSITPYWRKGTGPTVYPTWYNNRGTVTNNITYDGAKTSAQNGADLELILENLSAGANVVIHAGTYSISNRFEITAVGTALNPVFISAATGENVIITRPDANQNCINANNSAYVVLEGLTITNGSSGVKFGTGTADHWMIYNCKFFAVGDAAIAANSNDSSYIYVIDCEIYNTGGTGEGLYMGANSGIHKNHHSYYCGNYIHDLISVNISQGDGIEIKDGSYANTVKYNYITNTNYPGITIYGTQKGNVDRNVIEENVVINSNDYALQFAGEAIVRNNLIINNTYRAIYSTPIQNALPGYLDFCNNTVLSSGRALNVNSWTGYSNIIVANNFLYSSISDYIGGSTGSAVVTNNIQKNVLTDLINLSLNGANLELRPHPVNGTSLINSASATYLPAADIFGYTRSLTNDVGAQNSWVPILAENSTVTVNEGSSTIVKIRLGVKPISNTSIQMPHQTGDTRLSIQGGEPAVKIFSTSDWGTYQNIQINAAEDAGTANGTAAYLLSKSSGTDITNSLTINVNVNDNDVADTTAPTSPAGLSSTLITTTTFTLSWTASTDAVGVIGYKIFQGGVQIATSATTNYAVTGLTSSTTYSFTVSAYDAATNNSSLSSSLSVTTIAISDTTPPTTPTSLVATSITPTTFTLSWSSSTDAIGVTGYKIFQGGVQIGTSVINNFAVTGLISSTTYSFTVSAYDAASNNSTFSSTLSVLTSAVADTTPPTTPTNLIATSITPTTFTLTWSASTDDIGVTGYKIFQGGVQVGSSAVSNFAVISLTASTTYAFTVSAYDAASNNSTFSSTLSVSTPATADTTSPTIPTSLVASSITTTSFTLSWTPAIDTIGVTGYKIFQGGVQIGTSTSTNFAIIGLTASTTYSFTVSAYDASSNNSSLSSVLSVSTPATTDTSAPTTPTNLVATSITSTTLTLTWTASTDTVGVVGYKIFKGGVQIGTSLTNNFSITGLTASTNYSFTVSAYDAASNNSIISVSLLVTTSSNSLTIISISGDNGIISPSGNISVVSGNSQIFIITPNAGYEIENVIVDGSNVSVINSYTFNSVIINHTINVTFKLKSYSIISSTSNNGTILPLGNIVVNENANQIFTITPSAGYQVNEVLIDGVSIGITTRYTFTNVISVHTIFVSFKLNKFDHNISTLTSQNNTSINYLKVSNLTGKSFSVTTLTGYQFEKILADGVIVNEINNNSFSTLELIVSADESSKVLRLGNSENISKKSFLSTSKSILEFTRLEGAQGSLKITYEAFRYTDSSDIDIDMINGNLTWADGDANKKSIEFTSLEDAIVPEELFSIKILSVEEDFEKNSTDSSNTDTTTSGGASGKSGGGCLYSANMKIENQLGNLLIFMGLILIIIRRK